MEQKQRLLQPASASSAPAAREKPENASLVLTKPKDPRQRRQEERTRRWEVLKYLEHTYPLLFSRALFKPLKRGILEDLIAAKDFPFSKNRLRSALRLYTTLTGYLECFEIYFERYDLEGLPCDIVISADKEHAHHLLETRALRRENQRNKPRKGKRKQEEKAAENFT